MNRPAHHAAALLAFLTFGLTTAFAAPAPDRRPAESNEPWPEDSGVIALNIVTNADYAWAMIKEVKRDNPRAKVPELKTSATAADMCREFVRRYPDHGQVPAAKKMRCEFLIRTIELGNTNRIAEFEDLFHPDRVAEYRSLFPRFEIELARVRAFRAYPAGMPAVRQEWEKNLRSLTPRTPEIEFEVLKLAEQSDPDNAKRLARELISLPAASRPLKARATNILEKFQAIGQPIQLKGIALNGAEFDLAQWKGKVVLLHFWTPITVQARYYGMDPDWSGLLSARNVYDQFHGQGVEVLSINLARSEKLLRQGLPEEKQIVWPHYWTSATNLASELRAAAGMATNHLTLGVTAFALLDQNATLRDCVIPRHELADRIQQLLK